MLGRQERLAIVLLISVAALVIVSHLVLDHIGKRPFASNYSEQSEEGELVILSGTIERVAPTKEGGHCILNINNISVFIPNGVAASQTFSKGTNITIIGMVQTYEGKREITVQSASDIVVANI